MNIRHWDLKHSSVNWDFIVSHLTLLVTQTHHCILFVTVLCVRPVTCTDLQRSCSVSRTRLRDHVLQRLANPPSSHNSWKSMERSVNRGSSWCSSCATGLRLDRSRAPVMAGAKQVRGIGNDGDCKLIEWPDKGSWTSARTPQVVRRAANNCCGRPSVLWPGRKGYPALDERNGRSIIFKVTYWAKFVCTKNVPAAGTNIVPPQKGLLHHYGRAP